MQEAYVYDKAKYHYDGEYPKELPIEKAFVHTGFYLGWIIENDLYSEDFAEDMAEEIVAFKERKITGTKVYELCDGVLLDDMLNDEGNSFTQYYFDFSRGSYMKDYEILLAKGLPSFYHVEDTWENYDRLAGKINQQFERWKNPEQNGFWNKLINALGK